MILIIAEKPSVAAELAKVVGADRKERGYLAGGDCLVSWCIGHLIELAPPERYDERLKEWSLETLPILPQRYFTLVCGSTANQFNILRELMNRSDVTQLIEATDAGREGELIFRLVYHQAGCQKPFKRLWISSLEERSIRGGLAALEDGAAYDNLYSAALCRQRADWLVGMNFTRLFSVMYNRTLRIGRVQTPTVHLIVRRAGEIESFVPQTYFRLTAELGGFKAYTRVEREKQAEEIISRCAGRQAFVTLAERQEKKENPPALYDLTTLQRDANRLLGLSAQQTLDGMQKLYDLRLATYPRTDSRYITQDMEQSTSALIDTLLERGFCPDGYSQQYISLKQVINNAKVTDHHALLPTPSATREAVEALGEDERRLFFLVAYRLLTAASPPYRYTAAKVLLDIAGETFTAAGREILDNGWRVAEAAARARIKALPEEDGEDSDGGILPPMAEGNTFSVAGISAERKSTRPPRPYTEDTLLLAMETAGKNLGDRELEAAIKGHGLGTPATRAAIIENIIRNGYVVRQGKALLPTETGCTMNDLIPAYLREPELTARWEKQLAEIQAGQLTADAFMAEVTGIVNSYVTDTKALFVPGDGDGIFAADREVIGLCPRCGRRVLEYPKSYSCESGKGGCGFVIWKEICGRDITKAQAGQLLTKGRTGAVKGFTSKNGHEFSAKLLLKEDRSVGFEFVNDRKKKEA